MAYAELTLLGFTLRWSFSRVPEEEEAEEDGATGPPAHNDQPMRLYSEGPGFRIIGDGAAITTDT